MYIQIDNLNIHYTDSDSGSNKDVCIILQGWGTNLHVYDSIRDILKDKYRIIQLDFPGFGESDEPKTGWSVDEFTDFFLTFSKIINIKRATLIGHSYGGRVIIKAAARDNLPIEINNIVLIDSAGVMPVRTKEQEKKIARYKKLKKAVDNSFTRAIAPDLIANWKNRQGSADYRNATPIMKECLVKSVNEDLTSIFSKVNYDVLLIWGANDTATPLSDGQLMEKLMPRAGLAVIQNAGHYSFLDAPVIFKRILSSYLLGSVQ